MSTFTLDIVTPDGQVFVGPVQTVTLPGAEGEFGVFAGHNPVLTRLIPGELIYVTEAGPQSLAIGEGFVQVTADHMRVLTDMALREPDIDEQVVQQALARAQEALRSKTLIGEELEATEVSIARASAQLKLKRRLRSASIG